MNTIDFNKNDFPLTTTVLGLMQSAGELIEKIAGISAGNNCILSGCVVVGGAVTTGYVIINNEILPFEGGTLQSYVRVVETETVVTVQGYTYTTTTKSLVFGVGTGQMLWSSFKKLIDDLGGHTYISTIEDWNMQGSGIDGFSLDDFPENAGKIRETSLIILSDSGIITDILVRR